MFTQALNIILATRMHSMGLHEKLLTMQINSDTIVAHNTGRM